MTGSLTRTERRRLGYRPALDGLRAVAVLLVIAYHYFVPGVAGGGHAGVTVFFVLSGFLITTLLLEERDRTGRIDIRSFYLRRARRLLPALLFLVAVVLALALGRGRVSEVVPNAAATLFYVANWAQAGQPISLEHLSHAWSLAVEEQFYLIWPLALVCVMRVAPLGPVALAIMLAVAAVTLRVLGIDMAELERIDGIMIGCVLALRPLPTGTRLTRAGGWVGFGVVGLAATLALGHPPLGTLDLTVIALASALMIAAVVSDGERASLERALSWSPLVHIGRISYGLYLWHFAVGWELWPTLTGSGWHWLPSGTFMLAITLVLAAASYRYIERPFLRRGG